MSFKRFCLISLVLISFSYADNKIGVDKQYLYKTSQEKTKIYTIYGEEAKIISTKDDMVFVEYNNKRLGPIASWESSSILKEKNILKKEKTNMYIIKDDEVKILKKEGDWVYIKYKTKKNGDIKAWIPFSSLAKQDYPMQDIFNALDLTSFNSSIRPKITNKEIKLSQLDFLKENESNEASKITITNDTITIESSNWLYKIKAMMKIDKDYHVCFTDKALNGGSYDVQEPMVIRKKEDLYIVIDETSDVCKKWAK